MNNHKNMKMGQNSNYYKYAAARVKFLSVISLFLTHFFHSNSQEGVVLTDKLLLQSPLEGDRGRSILDQTESKEPPSMVDTVDQHRAGSFLCSQMNLENKPAPLYQRVLSALIVDDQTEETVGDENISFLCERDDSTLEAWDFENQFNNSRTEHGCNTDTVSCKGNATSEHTCMEDKLLLELQSVGIYPELVVNF